MSNPGEIDRRVSGYATLDNDGATYEASNDYSSTPGRFEFGPPNGEIWIVERMIVLIADGGSFAASEYGNTNSPLTNGVEVQFLRGVDTVVTTLNGLKPIKTNADWGGLCFDVPNPGAGASGDDALCVRWTFSKDGQAIRLNGDDDDRISVLISDDLSSLNGHTFFFGATK